MTLNGSMSGVLSSPQSLSGSLSLGGGGGITDPTLSIEGVAADAKAVGEKKADIIVDKAFGAIANMPDAKGSLPVNELLVNIQPVQAGSGNPSPSNVRTISGWTGATIKHSGADTGDYDTVTVSWQTEAGTVYGGTLNVTTGVLTVNKAIIDLGSLSYTKYSVTQGTMFRSNEISGADFAYNSTDFVCSNYATAKSASRAEYTISAGQANKVDIIDSNYSDATTFKSAMSGVKLVYPIATPTTTQLTPEQVSTLQGTNNIWADTGDVLSCEYKCDTKLYIQKLTMPTEDDMTANQNIASGKFFMIGNSLYYSTASIANGAKIIVGTNCNRVSLADALNNINS